MNKRNGFSGIERTSNKEPYTLRSSFTVSIMQTYSLLLELMTMLADREFVESSVFRHNHMIHTDTIASVSNYTINPICIYGKQHQNHDRRNYQAFAFGPKLSKERVTGKPETAWAITYVPRADLNMMYIQSSLRIPGGQPTVSLSVFLAGT